MADEFADALGRMGASLRRAHQAFTAADDAFIEALEGLKALTLARGSLDHRLGEMQDTIGRLEALVLDQSGELRALRQRIDPPPA